MTTVAAAATRGTRSASSTSIVADRATTVVKTTTTTPSVETAAVVDLSANAKAQLAKLAPPAVAGTATIKSFDEMVQDRTDELAADLTKRFEKEGIPRDEPIKLQLDSAGNVKTDSHYKEKIETMFKDDPDLAKAFKEVASLNSMKAAQKALEAFDREKKAAKTDDEKDRMYGLYTARLMRSQDLSGTMTLADGKLSSASADFMAKSVGEITPAEASERARNVSRTV